VSSLGAILASEPGAALRPLRGPTGGLDVNPESTRKPPLWAGPAHSMTPRRGRPAQGIVKPPVTREKSAHLDTRRVTTIAADPARPDRAVRRAMFKTSAIGKTRNAWRN